MAQVLIVEDDAPIRSLLDDFLSCEGFDTLLAENGRLGVDLAGSQRPDVILMDLMLPVLDGVSAVHILKSNPTTRQIRIIAMSAQALLLRPGPDFPVDDVVRKPFDLDALLGVIHELTADRCAPG